MEWKRTSLGWVALAAAIVGFQIVAPPPIGLADNGDFTKITARFRLRPPDADLRDYAFRYTNVRYQIGPEQAVETGFHSSESWLVQASLWLNRAAGGGPYFDIRWLGIVHAAVFLLACGLFAPLLGGIRAGPRIGLLALATLIFCDVAYSAHYNSFYMDAAALVFLLLSMAALLRAVRRRDSRFAWLAVIPCLLLVTAKSQHALLALPLAVFCLWERRALWPRRALLASSLAALALIGGAVFSLAEGSPPGYTTPCLFDIVFARLLPDSKDPVADLASLGLDKSYLRYDQMEWFSDASPMGDLEWARTFRAKTSFVRLAEFYCTHPGRALHVAGLALAEASSLRPVGIGNYDQSAGHAPYAQSGAFGVWNSLRRQIAGASPWAFALMFVLTAGVVTWRYPPGGCALALMGLIEFLLGALTDASEVGRHLFLFGAIWDIAFFAAVCAAAVAIGARGRACERATTGALELHPAPCPEG